MKMKTVLGGDPSVRPLEELAKMPRYTICTGFVLSECFVQWYIELHRAKILFRSWQEHAGECDGQSEAAG